MTITMLSEFLESPHMERLATAVGGIRLNPLSFIQKTLYGVRNIHCPVLKMMIEYAFHHPFVVSSSMQSLTHVQLQLYILDM